MNKNKLACQQGMRLNMREGHSEISALADIYPKYKINKLGN